MSEAIDVDLSAAEQAEGAEALVLSLDGFEGPLHLLLELARAKKLDIARVSITEIADQYLAFIEAAHAARMELAGDYLVMAAWLAALKARLLIPKPPLEAEEPDAAAVSAALRAKLMRLELARAAAERLRRMPQLGADVFVNGQPQALSITRTTAWKGELMDLLRAYCADRTKEYRRAHRLRPRPAYPLAEARKRLERLLPDLPDWRPLDRLAPAPDGGADAPPAASYLASVFGAALELAREGRMDLRQEAAFAPLFLRARRGDAQDKRDAGPPEAQ